MKKYKIAITTGDKKGIGKEITKKALDILKPDKNEVLIIGEKIDVNYDFMEINEAENGAFCYKSLEMACKLAQNGIIKGLTTAPVSKFELHKSGYYFKGNRYLVLCGFSCAKPDLCCSKDLTSTVAMRVKIAVFLFHFILFKAL